MNKEKLYKTLDRLQAFQPPEGYYLCFSGGKDSCVLKELANMADVKYDSHYNNTTIDPPELVKFIRQEHPDVKFERAWQEPFLKKLQTKGFPLRQSRWCCEILKEKSGNGRTCLVGIRWDESRQREKRQMVESCYKGKGKKFVHPIIDWTDADIWYFIGKYSLPYCKLYDEGFKRLGCLFCPQASKKMRIKELIRYPKYARAFEKAFCKLYENRIKQGKKSVLRWKDGKEMFRWWIYGE